MTSMPIFMRGDPLDLTTTFYMICNTSNTNGYVFCQNQGEGIYDTTTPVAGFLQLSDMYTDYPAIEFSIVSLGDNIYTFQPTNLNLTGYCLGVNSNGCFDLIEIQNDILVQIRTTIPSNNTDLNIYILDVLYPSLQYSLVVNYTSTTLPQKFYLFNLTSTNSWEYYTVFPQLVDVMFIPVNDGQLSVWQVNDDQPNGACYYSTSNSNLGIEWFYNWLNGTSTGCDNPSIVSSLSNNCYFSSNNSCLNGYLYNYCTNDFCGNCMGETNITGTPCMFNSPGSSIPLFATITPIETTSTVNMIELDDNTDSGCCGNCSSTQAFIIFVVLLIIIFIILAYYLTRKTSNSYSNTPQINTYY